MVNTLRRFSILAIALILILLLPIGCQAVGLWSPVAGPESSKPLTELEVSILIEVNSNDIHWHKGIKIPKGTNGYELTEIVSKGNLESDWYPLYRSHFIDSLLGVANKDPFFWLGYIWNEAEEKWEPLPIGADLLYLHHGHVIAWLYTDTSRDPAQLPSVTP